MPKFNARREAILVALMGLDSDVRLTAEAKIGAIAIALKANEVTEEVACEKAAVVINEAFEADRNMREATAKALSDARLAVKNAWTKALSAAAEMAKIYGQGEFDASFRERYSAASVDIGRIKVFETDELVDVACGLEGLTFEVNNFYPRGMQPAVNVVDKAASDKARAIRESRRQANRAARLAEQPVKGSSGAVNPGKKSPGKKK